MGSVAHDIDVMFMFVVGSDLSLVLGGEGVSGVWGRESGWGGKLGPEGWERG